MTSPILVGNPRRILRGFVIVLALAETAFFLLLVGFALAEDGPWRIARPIALGAAVPFAVAVLPALLLAWRDRLLPLALALSVGVLALALFAWPRL